MPYIKLPQPQKTLAIAMTLVGVYCNISLPGGDPLAQAQSAIPDVSTATPTLRLLMPGQAVAKSPLNNSNILVQQPKRCPGVQVTQTPPKPTDRGAPGTSGGAGTFATPGLPGTPGGGGTFEAPPKPIDRGAPAPGRRQDAGTRGPCTRRGDKPLTALVPITQETSGESQSPTAATTTSKYVLGLTVAEHPTFWFYVPYSLTPSLSVEFSLQDEKGKEVYKTFLTTSETSPGVVGFELPSTEAPLEVGKMYHWFFLIYCTPEDPVFVDGWVKRVALNPSLNRQLAQATPQQSFALYAKAGIWYEAVTSLAKLRRKNPDDATLSAEWTQLLKSIDLDAIAQEPITSVLTPKK